MVCETCRSLDSKIYSNCLSEDIDLGTIDELHEKSRTCLSCLEIAKHSRAPSGGSSAARIYLSGRSNTGKPILLSSEQNRSIRSLGYFIRKDDREDRGEILENRWIDLSRIQEWLSFCDTLHEGHCHHLPSENTIEGLEKLRFLDVENGCLVARPGNVKYFALSYVWGRSADAVETQRANLEMLEQEGNLLPDTGAVALPKTIRDAMRLVRSLGEKYLWVDRLCIVQDDLESKTYHILHMYSVYANSYCTIVAADGTNANYGLPGVGAGSAPRWYVQRIIRFPQATLVAKTEDPSHGRPHGRRGWTFQEVYLSRRCLIFSENSVFWECQRSSWREDTRSNPEDVRTKEEQQDEWSLRFDAWPNLHHWANLVCSYNYRDLTYPEDAQSAFTGLEKVLERSFPGGFLYGLPEFFFDYALLWQPLFPLERRIQGKRGCAMPSWSWLGWKGRMDMHHCKPDDFFRHRHTYGTLCKIEPVAEWTQLGPTPDMHRRVRNDYSSWRAKAGTSFRSDRWIESRDGQETFYTTPQVPDIEFTYPWPSVPELPPIEAQRSWPPRLRLRSTRAFLVISEVFTSIIRRGELPMIVKLATKQGKWAGLLHLNIRQDDKPNAPVGQECELVALSKGRVMRVASRRDFEFEEMNWAEMGEQKGKYGFYNVLWVRWVDGHVVREALGRVERSVWDELAKEEVDVAVW